MNRYEKGIEQEKINSWIETLEGKKAKALSLLGAEQEKFKKSFTDLMVPLEPELRDLVRLGQCVLDGAMDWCPMFGRNLRGVMNHGMVPGWFSSMVNTRGESFFGFISTQKKKAEAHDFGWGPGMHIDAIGFRGPDNSLYGSAWFYYIPESHMWSVSDPTQGVWENVLSNIGSLSLGDIYELEQLMQSFRNGYSEFIRIVKESMETLIDLTVDEYVGKRGKELLEVRKKEEHDGTKEEN